MTRTNEEISEETGRPLSPAGVLTYCLANLGYGAFYAFNNYVHAAVAEILHAQCGRFGTAGRIALV